MIDVPIRVKESLEEGNYLKNYRFIILKDNGEEDFTIDNNNLVSESVNIDERLCSEDTIKFGLCEGSHLQFEYFGFPDITERRIQAYIDVQYKEADSTLQWYPIPMGFFEVKECPMQFSTGIRRCSCYNKLKSEYLDAKADGLVKELVAAGESAVTDELSMYTLLKMLLQEYSIEEKIEIKSEIDMSISGMGFNVDTTQAVSSDGISLGGYWQSYNVSAYFIPKGFSQDDFLNFDIYAKQIYQKLKDKRIILSSAYTMANGTVYTLEEYSKANYIRSKYFGGYAYINSTSGEEIFRSEFSKAEEEKTATGYITNIRNGLHISIPVKLEYGTKEDPPITTEIMEEMERLYTQFVSELSVADCYQMVLSPIEKHRLTTDEIAELSDITLRKLQSAVYETRCLFGRLDRETDLFSGVALNKERLLPAQTLYPDNALYPIGTSMRARKNTYRQLWAENGKLKKFRNLVITYRTVDGEGTEIEKTLQRTVNSDGTTNYNMSDNWLFRNLVWTQEEIETYADEMVEKMKNMTWFPFEMWCAGYPFIETGDEIEILVGDKIYTTYILQRQMKGIQNLEDSYVNGTLNIF